ncbi:MAG: hypothetical protein V2B20_17175, partial [Pseudomonadota bacterium]
LMRLRVATNAGAEPPRSGRFRAPGSPGAQRREGAPAQPRRSPSAERRENATDNLDKKHQLFGSEFIRLLDIILNVH